jgi:hypothetical protein
MSEKKSTKILQDSGGKKLRASAGTGESRSSIDHDSGGKKFHTIEHDSGGKRDRTQDRVNARA